MNLKCNYCGQEYSGDADGAPCEACNEGVLIAQDPPPKLASGESVREILAKTTPAPLPPGVKIHMAAQEAETSARVFSGIGIFFAILGVVAFFNYPIAAAALLSIGGAFLFWGAIYKIIAQLMYIRATLMRDK